jgi:hypothetical protein
MPSPELGAGPEFTAALATAAMPSIVIVSIAAIAIALINFFVSITTNKEN